MATVDKWRTFLNEHTFTKKLRENNVKESKRKKQTEAKRLIASYDNDLFVWDKHSSHIIYYNVQNLILGVAKERQDRYQILQCTDVPKFDVDCVTWNQTGSHVALWGQLGIMVVELPQKWGKYAEYQGGRDVVSCKSTSIAEHYFSSHQGVRLLQVAWHLGSHIGSHLVFLTSDNKLSIYNTLEPDQPHQLLYLGDDERPFEVSRVGPHISTALGDNAVGFDFGEPVPILSRHRQGPPKGTVWPVYCVKGNGDVVIAYSDLTERAVKLPVQGPLLMHPPAEDNYGNDACDILCLATTPPVVVIATCEGRLHHCILLAKALEDSSLHSDMFGSQESTGTSISPPEEGTLYVYETVELELLLTTPTLTGTPPPEEVFTCPVKLMKDPSNPERYHCCHAAGVHTVALPWIQQYERFCSQDEDEDCVPDHRDSVVEHLICTTPLPTSPPSPILGLALVRDISLGSVLLTLSSDYEFLCLRLSDTKPSSSQSLALSSTAGQSLPSPLRRLPREPFDDRIRGILHRNTSNPLIKSGENTEMSQQECFQLLSRSTQVFREEYIQKQDLARQEISRRVAILQAQKQQQLSNLRSLQESRNILADQAEKLGGDCEDCKEKQEDLLHRLEDLMRKLQSRVPFLSDNERNMKRELENMEERLDVYKRGLEQLKVKQEYQERQIRQSKKTSQPSPVIKKSQMTQLQEVLKHEGDELAELMKKVNQLKMDSS